MMELPKNKDLVFVDIEANDKPKRILQFGAVKSKINGDIESRNWFSNPKCKLSSHIHKIVYKNLKNIEDGMSSIRIIDKINKFLNNTILITYGPFDFSFLDEMSKKVLKKKLNVEHIDLQNEWKSFSMSKNVWALNKLAKFFSINVVEEKLHDAYYDAETLFKIWNAWNKKDKLDVINDLYNFGLSIPIQNKLSQNKENSNAKTINNTKKNRGQCFIKVEFSESKSLEKNKRLLSNIDLLEISSNQIKRNWSFNYNVGANNFDILEYENDLVIALKKVINSIKDKKIIINESDYQRYIRLTNICAKYLDVYPINNILFTTGYQNLYNQINIKDYKFSPNMGLIKNWKVYEYLVDKKEKNYS